jgi:hypothetical protein
VRSCPSFETLVALWAGDLDESEAMSIDEHVFGCDACTAASTRLAQLVGGLRETIPFVISHAHRDRLAADGSRIRVTRVEPNATAHAHFAPEVDLLVHALRGDFSLAERVDISISSPTDPRRIVVQEVAFDRESGEILIACQRHYEPMFSGGDLVFSVDAIERGQPRRIGDYLVVHHWR